MMPLILSLTAGIAQAVDPIKRTTPSPSGRPTEIALHVPLDAIVWIDGARTENHGPLRSFVTPPLASGRRYFYDVKVSWVEGARSRVIERHLSFRAGQRITLNLAPGSRTQPQPTLLVDPEAPAPWRTEHNEDPLNAPNYPSLFSGYRWYPR
ncbi:MAG TPA: TIGR03000 domain-containing protein [Gemmataceae bacterium]|nr:TIGR03000 domain-containing protein [Gemmataceae bacterium]